MAFGNGLFGWGKSSESGREAVGTAVKVGVICDGLKR